MNTRRITTDNFEALPNDILTHRDTETLVRMAQGLNARKMSESMGVTVATARTYMGRVNEKLEVTDKAAAVCRAFCLGILKPLCLLLVVSQMAITLGTANMPARPTRTIPRVVRVVRNSATVRDMSVIRA